MKARVKKTGEIIDVDKILEAEYHDRATSGIDEKIYYESDLEFDDIGYSDKDLCLGVETTMFNEADNG